MRTVTRNAKKTLKIRELAGALVKECPEKDWKSQIICLHAFVRDRIKYVRDINGVETIQTPEKTLEYGYGDCDDKSTLLASLLEATGHPTRFVAISLDGKNYCHVFPETLLGRNTWIALEATEKWPAGKKPYSPFSPLVVYN